MKEKWDKPKNDQLTRSVIYIRLLILVLLVVAVLSIGGHIAYQYQWFFNVGQAEAPRPIDAIPTAFVPEIRDIQSTGQNSVNTIDPGSTVNSWMTATLPPEEALALREQANVINYALLQSNNSVDYLNVTEVPLTDTRWQNISVKPFGLDSLTVNGTSVSLVFGGKNFPYVLNVHQPFIITWLNAPVSYLVDQTGQLWQIYWEELSEEGVEIATVQAELPLGILPNPNLSMSY